MRVLTPLAVFAALLAPAAAHAKGGAVTAAEVCDPGGCRPAEPTAELDGLMPAVWAAVGRGAGFVAAPEETPSFRIRLAVENLHGTLLAGRGHAPPIATVEIDFAPEIEAVRMVEPRTKGHWTRVDGGALRTLRSITGAATPSRETAERSERSGGEPLAAGFAALALVALGGALARRRRR